MDMYPWAASKNKFDRAVASSFGGNEGQILDQYRKLGGLVLENFVPEQLRPDYKLPVVAPKEVQPEEVKPEDLIPEVEPINEPIDEPPVVAPKEKKPRTKK